MKKLLYTNFYKNKFFYNSLKIKNIFTRVRVIGISKIGPPYTDMLDTRPPR